MSRYTDAKCRICRRAAVKLFLKGNRCQTGKCAVSKRENVPGASRWRRTRQTDYGVRLREKQKLKSIYGLYEKPFRRIFEEADRQKGNTGENLLMLLERRLDSVVLNAGFALSRSHARQMIVHGHVRLNGRKARSPGQLVRVADVVSPLERASAMKMVTDALAQTQARVVPTWISRQLDPPSATIIQLPTASDFPYEINQAYIVEFASR
jgi:small subunit ribosomal protein S4